MSSGLQGISEHVVVKQSHAGFLNTLLDIWKPNHNGDTAFINRRIVLVSDGIWNYFQ